VRYDDRSEGIGIAGGEKTPEPADDDRDCDDDVVVVLGGVGGVADDEDDDGEERAAGEEAGATGGNGWMNHRSSREREDEASRGWAGGRVSSSCRLVCGPGRDRSPTLRKRSGCLRSCDGRERRSEERCLGRSPGADCTCP
jgi:hypothetical protein